VKADVVWGHEIAVETIRSKEERRHAADVHDGLRSDLDVDDVGLHSEREMRFGFTVSGGWCEEM
jgi:hypothetical protein